MAGPGVQQRYPRRANLGWKLAAVVNGRGGRVTADTYDVERRKHARAMIDLSTTVGRVISPTNRTSPVPAISRSERPPWSRPSSAMCSRCGSSRCRSMNRARWCTASRPRRGGHPVHPAARRHPRRAERPCSTTSSALVRGAVLEQPPAKDSGRAGLCGLEVPRRGLRRAAPADPAVLARPGRRRRRRGR